MLLLQAYYRRSEWFIWTVNMFTEITSLVSFLFVNMFVWNEQAFEGITLSLILSVWYKMSWFNYNINIKFCAFYTTKERWPSKIVNFFMSVQISTKHIWEVCIHLCLSICLSCYSRFMNKSLILMYWFKGISNVSEFHHFEVKIVLIKMKKENMILPKKKSWISDFLIKHDYLWEKKLC